MNDLTPAARAALRLGAVYGSPLDVIAYCLRGMLVSKPGHKLAAADLSNIEGRGLAWLAGEEWKLQAFRDYDTIIGFDPVKKKPIRKGPDLYHVTAAGILNKLIEDITEDERQSSGKVPELACGFQGGIGAFQSMAKIYNVKVSDEQADAIKNAWRGRHPRTVQYWADVEDAAVTAVLRPGIVYSAGAPGRQVKYLMQGSFLTCRLPSGRILFYPYPKILPVETPWGQMKDSLTYMKVVSMSGAKKDRIIPDPAAAGDWQRVSTYGGSLVENVTQAVCRDFLALAIKRVRAAGYAVVLHVHDEIVCEVPDVTFSVAPEVTPVQQLQDIIRLCSVVPPFAAGMPISAKGWVGRRYKKD